MAQACIDWIGDLINSLFHKINITQTENKHNNVYSNMQTEQQTINIHKR